MNITYEQWWSEAMTRYPDENIVFVCPVCGHQQSIADYELVKAPIGTWGSSCIGRFINGSRRAFGGKGTGPCDYTGGGLFALNPIHVILDDGNIHSVFNFADDPLLEKNEKQETKKVKAN